MKQDDAGRAEGASMPNTSVAGDAGHAPEPAPRTLGALLRQLGPGLILSSIIVGSGELIVTPKLGAEAGFTMLWFIVVGCLLKVFVQIELGRHTIMHGRTTLEALNRLPGPRMVVSWLLWLWLVMFLCLVPQVAGMIGGTAIALRLFGVGVDPRTLCLVVGIVTAVLLVLGRYRFIEIASTALVAAFTLTTVFALAALQQTPYAITGAHLANGFAFRVPASIATAFGAFGIIGVGASELIYYPYWCLEKGYARRIGPDDGTAAWQYRAKAWLRVMRIDAWTSCAIYTATTVAFYLLGAAILHERGLRVESSKMIETLSYMYRDAFGEGSMAVFLLGAIAVLYSTIFGATASNARLLVDALGLFRLKQYRGSAHRLWWTRLSCVILVTASTAVFMVIGNPVHLVLVGAIAQGLMLPFLAGAAVYFHFTNPHPALRAGPLSLACLVLAFLAMAALGAYQAVTAW